MKLPFLLPLTLAAALLVSGCGHLDLQPEGDPDRVLTGTVNFHASEPLPPDTVVLFRMHHFVKDAMPIPDRYRDRFFDVTSFPDGLGLLHVTDLLITDYSSVMFDFSVTGKPMYFLVPDMEHYRGELRGFYFDLVAHAPGAVVRTQAELVRELREGDPTRFASRYAEWREKFNSRDDGRAAERVVDRILDQGFLDRPAE